MKEFNQLEFLFIYSFLKNEIENNTSILGLFSEFVTFHKELGTLSFENGALSQANYRLAKLEGKLDELLSSFGHHHVIVLKLQKRFETTQKCLELLSMLYDTRLEERQVTNFLFVHFHN